MKPNDIVIHPLNPNWGAGKILEISEGTKARVFFENAGDKKMLLSALKLAEDRKISPFMAQITKGTSLKGFRPLPDLVAAFLRQYPAGFQDAHYLKDERDYKVAASAYFHEHLNQEAFLKLLEIRDYATVMTLALRTISKTNLIFPNEIMSLKDGLAASKYESEFAARLYLLLYGDFEKEFDNFIDLLSEIKACKWTIATYFPFLLDPSTHIFVKPAITQKAAEAFAYEISYDSMPSLKIYSRIQRFIKHVSNTLSKDTLLAPRDLIDVQSFLWCSQQ